LSCELHVDAVDPPSVKVFNDLFGVNIGDDDGIRTPDLCEEAEVNQQCSDLLLVDRIGFKEVS